MKIIEAALPRGPNQASAKRRPSRRGIPIDDSSIPLASLKRYCADFKPTSEEFYNNSRGRPFSELTQRIIKCLSDTYPDAQNAWEIADSLKAPYKSVYSSLTRLAKRKVVERVKGKPRGYFRLPDDVFLRTYANLRPVRLGGFRTMSDLLVHRVGLWGECPGLLGSVLELGGLEALGLRNVEGGGGFRDRSINYSASMEFLADGAYFQRACEPVPVSVLPFMAQDLVESVAFRTRGLKRPSSVQLRDCEIGNDYVCDPEFGSDGFQLLKVYFPSKLKKKARVHLQFSGLDLPVPLSVEGSDLFSDLVNRKVGQTVRFLSTVLARRGVKELPGSEHRQLKVLRTNWQREVFQSKVQSIVEGSLTASQETSCITSLAESWGCGLIQSGP